MTYQLSDEDNEAINKRQAAQPLGALMLSISSMADFLHNARRAKKKLMGYFAG
jgi:hypothetical protein